MASAKPKTTHAFALDAGTVELLEIWGSATPKHRDLMLAEARHFLRGQTEGKALNEVVSTSPITAYLSGGAK